MRIATWNVNSIGARLHRVLDWLKSAKPDVLCLQETKSAANAFPTAEIGALGYEVAAHGAGRWNGVAIVSRIGVSDVRRGLLDEPGYQPEDAMFEVDEQRAIGATCGGVRVWSVYVPNGREVGHAHYDYKLRWLDALRSTVVADRDSGAAFVLMGDFNIAPTDDDVWDTGAYDGLTHVTPAERAKLAALREAQLTDVMPRALKYDVAFTYWDYRQLAFPKNRGMRIDLVYADARFVSRVCDAYVDREARKGKGASDHAPVVVDLT
ncbi:MAG: exodeoxyribonuclease III [Nocardioidaceae bacterium]